MEAIRIMAPRQPGAAVQRAMQRAQLLNGFLPPSSHLPQYTRVTVPLLLSWSAEPGYRRRSIKLFQWVLHAGVDVHHFTRLVTDAGVLPNFPNAEWRQDLQLLSAGCILQESIPQVIPVVTTPPDLHTSLQLAQRNSPLQPTHGNTPHRPTRSLDNGLTFSIEDFGPNKNSSQDKLGLNCKQPNSLALPLPLC